MMNKSKNLWWLLTIIIVAVGLVIWTVYWPHPLHVATFSLGARVNAVAVDPNGTFIVGGSTGNNQIAVWNIETGELIDTLIAYPCFSGALAISPDGQWLLAGYENGAVLLWDIQSPTAPAHVVDVPPLGDWQSRDLCIPEPDGRLDGRRIRALAWSPDGKLVAASLNTASIQVIHMETGEIVYDLDLPGEFPSPHDILRFSPDSHLLASVGSDRIIYLWDLDNGTIAEELPPRNDGHIDEMQFLNTRDALAVIKSQGGLIEHWSVDDGQRIFQEDLPGGANLEWCMRPDGEVFAYSGTYSRGFFQNSGLPFWGGRDDPSLYAFRRGDEENRFKLHGHSDGIVALACNFDHGWIVSGSWDGTVRLWRVPEFDE